MQAHVILFKIVAASLPTIQKAAHRTQWIKIIDHLLEHGLALQEAESEAAATQIIERLLAPLLEDAQIAAILTGYDLENPDLQIVADHRAHPQRTDAPAAIVSLPSLAKGFIANLQQARAKADRDDDSQIAPARPAPQTIEGHQA